MGRRSSGGGSGGTGAVSYPPHMNAMHTALLGPPGSLAFNLVGLVNNAINNSPFLSANAYDPTVLISAAINEVGVLLNAAKNLPLLNLSVTLPGPLNNAIVAATINSTEQLHNDVILPEYRTGARDLGMVMSSAFALGESLIVQRTTRDLADIAAKNAVEAAQFEMSKIALQIQMDQAASKVVYTKHELIGNATQLFGEVRRIAIVAYKEWVDQNISLDESDAQWPFEVMQNLANGLASIGGGVMGSGQSRPSPISSAIGGALSGAAMGGMLAGASKGAIGGPAGMAVGAVLGLATSFF